MFFAFNPEINMCTIRTRFFVAFLTIVIVGIAGGATFGQSGGTPIGSNKKITKKSAEKERQREKEKARLAAKNYNAAANKKAQKGDTLVLPMEYYGESEPLTELVKKQKPVSKENGMIQENEMEPLFEEPDLPAKKPLSIPETFLQTETSSPFAPIAGANFEGPGTGLGGFSLTGAPPDTTMAVGPNHIVAWVNSQYAVFDKTGTVLLGPVNGNTLFTGVGGNCETTNRGDPILQYDRLADRWILSQFAFSAGTTAPYFQCIAVSTTGNPMGTYVRYTVAFSATSPSGLNDYGKLGIWNDAYYTAYNMFGGSPAGSNTGVALCASDRTKMLSGDPTATTLCAPIAFYAGGGSFLPADIDGPNLPSDLTGGGLFMRQNATTALNYIRLKPDFAASTVTITDGFGGATGSFVSLPSTVLRACNGTGGTCVAQPGTAQTLDTLGGRLMYRLAFRNRNGIESMVVTEANDPDAGGARSSAIRWWEIRNPLGNPADADTSKRPFIYQSALYDPGASGDRWMGSMATDKYGNMLVGYSLVNAGTGLKPSIAVAGRSQCDPINTLQAEQIAVTGTGSQTGSSLSRWGDYSTMQVDPADDTTFWYTTQYLSADGAFNWRTRIVSFRFPTTTATATGDFNTGGNWSNGVPSATVSGVVPTGRTMTVSAPTTVCNLDVQAGGNVVMNSNLDVTGSLTLGNSINTSANTLGLGCNATVSGASSLIFVIGTVRKDYCATGGFRFPTGTANGYSPVDTNVTTLTTNPSSLSVNAVQSSRLGMTALNSVKRYWTLAQIGSLTTDLTFNYLDPTDVAGTESSYKLYRWNGATPTAVSPFTLNTAANTMSANGISAFSDWAIGNLGPSAANVSVAGRVLTADGRGVRNAIVSLTDSNGNTLTARTTSFGYYHFDDVLSGGTYVISVTSKRYQFAPRSITVADNVTDFDLIADAPFGLRK